MTNRILLLLWFSLLTCAHLSAQLLSTEPFFPKADDEVTIFFDATQGNGGLANCNCDVYIHTGVITNASLNDSDWKNVVTDWGVANPAWRMERVPGNPNLYKYTISPSINDFYNIGANEQVEKLAFVFRNGDGSREGKTAGGGDIFYNVFEEGSAFNILLLSPAASSSISAEIGETIPIELAASDEATITVFDNGIELTQATGRKLEYDLVVSEPCLHTVEVVADNGSEQLTRSFTYAVSAVPPDGIEPGMTVEGDSLLRLVLFAPCKEEVFVIGDFNDWQRDTAFRMTPMGSSGYYELEIGGLQAGETYRFQYLVDGSIRIADPYSTLVLDPIHDPFIPAATYPGRPAYPTGKTTGIVSVIQPGAPAYEWAVEDFQRPPNGELIVYELLIRDFIDRHDYATLIDTLGYLDRLGINAIELMPVNEFEGNISWGYNPSYHLALDKYYGPKNEFKRFVDSCHARGIAVILDVVFNHAFSQSPLAQLYWDQAAFRPTPDNPWLNPEARHPFNVGYDFNHESKATEIFVDKALRYWLTEFRVDGFRFDLSKGFTQKQSFDDGLFRRYDLSRVSILKGYADVVWEASPGAYVILEHFAESIEEQDLANYGMMLWGGFDVHDNYVEAAMGFNSSFTQASYRSRSFQEPHLVAYMESHDEERMMYKARNFGNSSGNYNIRNFGTALDRVELASVFFYTIPGPKMLWQFGELGYDLPINYCPNGTISEGCRTDPKPIRWEYAQDPQRRDVYELIGSLLSLREEFNIFHTRTFTLDVNRRSWKKINLRNSEMEVVVLGNFDVVNAQVLRPFTQAGRWYEFFSGDSLSVSDPDASLTLAPGKYRLYSTRNLREGGDRTTARPAVVKDVFRLNVVPNPAVAEPLITYTLEKGADVEIGIYNLMGQRLTTYRMARQPAGDHQLHLDRRLAPGAYIVRLRVDEQVEAVRMVIGN